MKTILAFILITCFTIGHAHAASSSHLQTAQKMYSGSHVVAVPNSNRIIIVRKQDGTIISIYINCSDYKKWTKTVIIYPRCKIKETP